MPLICPNISHPDWKALEAKLGEDGAWKAYFANNNKIPNPNDLSIKPKQTKIQTGFGALGRFFRYKDTLDSMENHPEDVAKILDELGKVHPNVRVFKDKIVTEDGTFVVPEGKKGMHYKSATVSAIAYANGAYLETVPHEYVHEYIEMFEDAPIIQEGIEKYGKERFVTLVGRKYTGQKMSKSFNNYIERFWKYIKNLFSGPSIVDIVTDSFSKNEQLSEPITKGNAVINYQDDYGPKIGARDITDFNEDFADPDVTKAIKFKSADQTRVKIVEKFKKDNILDVKNFSNVINLTKTTLTNSIVKPIEGFVSDLSDNLIQLKDSPLMNTVKNKIQDYTKPELNSLTQDEALDVVRKIQEEAKEFSLTNDQSEYQGKGLRLERQSNFIARIQDRIIVPNQNMAMGSTVGNLIDIVARDIFDGTLKSLEEYTQEANQMNKVNDFEIGTSPDVFANIVSQIQSIKADLDNKGMKTVAKDVFVYREYTDAEKEESGFDGVGGTLDLVAVDSKGNIHIIDFKNKILNPGAKEEWVKGAIYDGVQTDEFNEPAEVDKWAKQQSTYQMLMEAQGVPVKSTNILPVSTSYATKTEEEINFNNFDRWFHKLIKNLTYETQMDKDRRGNRKEVTNYVGVDKSVIDALRDYLTGNDKGRFRIISKIMDPNLVFDKKAEEMYNLLMAVAQAVDYKKNVGNDYLSKTGKSIDATVVENELRRSIRLTNDNREELLASKGKFFRFAHKHLGKLLKWVTNTGLWAKYLSGSEHSLFSRILNDQILQGEIDSAEFSIGYYSLFKEKNNPYFDNSSYHNPNKTIDQFETKTFTLNPKINKDANKAVELTKTEMLMIYLMNRQADGRQKLINRGIKLNQIEGRNINLDTYFVLTEAQINEIAETIENDKNAQAIVDEIDAAMDYQHTMVNKIFRIRNGRDLPKIKNYFPMFHGADIGNIRKSKNLIEDYNALRERKDDAGPIRLVDPFKAVTTIGQAASRYYGYAIPVYNATKALNAIKGEFEMGDKHRGYIKMLQGTIDKVQDSSQLFSSQGEQDTMAWINKVQGNFAVSVLAMNMGVIFKQQVSLVTARNEIDNKFISASGPGIFGINIINPMTLFKQLKATGFKEGETYVPVEWDGLIKHPFYDELVKYAPDIAQRFQGMISRETGEAIMGRLDKSDKINLTKYFPFLKGKDGKNFIIDKNRLMQGITLMDTLTIMRLYNAVTLETKSRMGEEKFAKLSEDEIREHNINRLRELITKTQPTFNITNRTGLARSSDPLARGLTMFTSAIQKMSMQNIDSIVDYINNPTKENFWRSFNRIKHTAVTTAIMLATIDLIFHGLLSGFDDDDWERMPANYLSSTIGATIGSLPVVGNMSKIITSQLDSNPWYVTQQDPVYHILQEMSEGTANLIKGNPSAALKQLSNAGAKGIGLPITPLNYAKKISKHELFN